MCVKHLVRSCQWCIVQVVNDTNSNGKTSYKTEKILGVVLNVYGSGLSLFLLLNLIWKLFIVRQEEIQIEACRAIKKKSIVFWIKSVLRVMTVLQKKKKNYFLMPEKNKVPKLLLWNLMFLRSYCSSSMGYSLFFNWCWWGVSHLSLIFLSSIYLSLSWCLLTSCYFVIGWSRSNGLFYCLWGHF